MESVHLGDKRKMTSENNCGGRENWCRTINFAEKLEQCSEHNQWRFRENWKQDDEVHLKLSKWKINNLFEYLTAFTSSHTDNMAVNYLTPRLRANAAAGYDQTVKEEPNSC